MKSLADQMSVYAAYHDDATNKAIHFVFVPLIVWSGMGLLIQVGTWPLGPFSITLAHLAAVALLAYYLALDFPLGVAMVVLFTILLTTALQMDAYAGARAWWFFLAVFAASWVAQIIGHAAFEHRKPALVDNVWQVFVAPIFVMAEWGFALGLRKQLLAQVQVGMQAHKPKAQ
jgi:uncharacterized membrane protein YGL010W